MSRQPCKRCPFRATGGLPFCEDGHDALEHGHEPFCHIQVGAGLQFDDPMPGDTTACVGFHRWLAGDANYSVPKRIPAIAE